VNDACQENLECHFGYACHGISRPALEYLKLSTFRTRWYHLHTLLLVQVYLGYKFCPSVLETVCLRVPTRYLRDFSSLNVCPAIRNCPARCASAANVVCRDFDIFRTQNVSLDHILL
jgi:hypothetical protein